MTGIKKKANEIYLQEIDYLISQFEMSCKINMLQILSFYQINYLAIVICQFFVSFEVHILKEIDLISYFATLYVWKGKQ